jgi:hypothetical protein
MSHGGNARAIDARSQPGQSYACETQAALPMRFPLAAGATTKPNKEKCA